MIGAALKRLTGGNGGVDAFTAIDKLRQAIILAKGEIADLDAMPIPRDQAEAALDAGIARLGQIGADALTSGIATLTRPAGHPDFAPRMTTELLFGLIVSVQPQAIRQTVGKELDRVYAGKKALPTMAARAKARDALEAKALEAELEEERLIRQIEAAGVPILRRRDADPRAVLARLEA